MNVIKKLPKISISLLVSIIVILAFMFLKIPSKITLAAEVDTNLMNITKLIDEQIKKDPKLAFSSNPYDYIENNEYYDNIINKGIDALPILEEKLQNSNTNGLVDYITAIAIEEITKCNLKNDANTTWESAKEFNGEWNSFVKAAPTEIENVLNSTSSMETKIKKLDRYGKLAAPYLDKFLSKDKSISSIESEDNQLIEQYMNKLTTAGETEKINKYFNDKIN